MSQSPIDEFSEATVLRYRQGWQALNRLLHEDRSFSGHERHNVYLNCGSKTAGAGSSKFADVSAVTGLDFAEDGRAIAPVDWDFDGDLDLWITNRTAPRVRFLANQSQSTGAFVSVQLIGDGKRTNRDAIGARVTARLADGTSLIKTRQAGESFLSQSSQWMHFGLGPQTAPIDVSVRWPGGTVESFPAVPVNQHHLLHQGSGRAEPWKTPTGVLDLAKGNSEIALPKPEATARIVLADGVALPELRSIDGEAIALDGQPTLINLWATWCRPCLEELATWGPEAKRFADDGLQVLALNVDEDAQGRGKAPKLLEKLGVPFPNIAVAPESVRGLDIIQRSVLDRWEPLPVPCSFLVDSQGFIVAIYKGPVPLDVVLSDAKTLFGADRAERRRAAVPFPGIWTHDPPASDPLYASSQFVDHDLVPAALAYIQRATAMDQRLRPEQYSNTIFADRYFVMATLLKEQGLPQEAIQTYERARDLNPRDLRTRRDLGDVLKSQRFGTRAIDEWKAALAINPKDLDVQNRIAMTHLQLSQPRQALPYLISMVKAQPRNAQLRYFMGTAFQKIGELEKAITAFSQSTQLDSNLLNADNNIAWIRATHPDATLRDGQEAVRLASAICTRSRFGNPNLLDTLAVSYAENDQFDQALETVDRALKILEASKRPVDPKIIAKFQARRDLFTKKQAYRDQSLVPSTPTGGDQEG